MLVLNTANPNKEKKVYGNILATSIKGEDIHQAITKALYNFYESNNAKNLILIDSIENHFLVLPYDILKSVIYDRANYFADILKLFYEWRYFKWVTSKNTELLEHMLRYYFFNTNNPNLLYECWVFYKILDTMVDNFKIKFKESAKSETTFISDDGSVKVIYQRRYRAKWFKKDEVMYEIPDSVIEFKNGFTIVVDTKNAEYGSDKYNPYRRQIDDYMGYANAQLLRAGKNQER